MKINCSVDKCSHNSDGICYSNRVDIAGNGAKTDCDTCCGAFLNKQLYSNLTNNTNSAGPCDCLVCQVNTCAYNYNNLCQLDSINVTGSASTNIYTETNCSSFSNK